MPVIYHKNTMYGGGSGGSGGASAISDLTDVELTNLADGQILKYDAVNQKWVNNNESGGGIETTTIFEAVTAPSYGVTYSLENPITNYDFIEIEYGQWSETRFKLVALISREELQSLADDNRYVFLSGYTTYGIHVMFDTDSSFIIASGISSTYTVFSIKGINISGASGASSVSELTDVDLDNLQDGQILQYNSTTQKWENADNEGGGGVGQVSALAYQQLTPTQYENLTTAEKNNGTIYFVSENSTGASGLKVITISQADYNNLTTEEKNNGVPYFVH